MSANERSSDAYIALLEQQSEEVNFFQAVRLLEKALGPEPQLRFKVVNSEAFHPNFIAGIKNRKLTNNINMATVAVNGFGVTGVQGPIPQCYSELLQRAEIIGKKGKEDPNAFLDIFHDRIISLLYHIKKHFNPMLFNEQPEEHDLYTLFSSINGFSTLNLFEHLPVKKDKLSSFSPIIANRRVDYSLILNVLKQYLGYQVKITPNQGAWRKFPCALQAKLTSGNSTLSSQQSMGLGRGIGLGNKYWDTQAAIKIAINVPSVEVCHSLLPKGEEHKELCSLLSFLTDGKYLVYVELLIDWHEVPISKLNEKTKLTLGQTSWLNTSHVSFEPSYGAELNENNSFAIEHSTKQSLFTIVPNISHDFVLLNNEVAA